MLRILPYLIGFLILLFFFNIAEILNKPDNNQAFGSLFETLSGLSLKNSDNKEQLDQNITTSSIYNKSNTNIIPNNPDILQSSGTENKEVIGKYRPRSIANISNSKALETKEIEEEYNPAQKTVEAKISKMLEDLEQRSQLLESKENALQAIQAKLDEKLKEFENKREKLNKIQEYYKDKSSAEINKLVRVYENMKAKDAAKIFEKLELGTLINVAKGMKELKLAGIIAEMRPEQARDLTIALLGGAREQDHDTVTHSNSFDKIEE